MKALRLAVLALLPLFVTTALLAQSSTTSVRGVVTDPSGAIVPGATVTISDTASGFTATRTTSGQGEFQFVQIAPGKYTFKASAAGFAVQTTVANLLVSQPATLNFKLSVNASTVTMDVSAAAETINLSDATIGNAVSSATIESLPTEARNVPSLLSLQPGVLFLGNDVGGGDSRNGVVSGARADQTNLSLDGLDNNQQLGGAAFTGVLRSTVDSVEEFRVTTSNSNADNGRSSGAQVNIVTKSGTNTFHGALYEYNRSNLGQANDWFNKQTQAASGLPNRPGKLIYNVYGATLGGPVKKDKFFFFLNYEGNRTLIGNQITQTVPTDALRAGNISYPHTDASGQTTNVSLTPSQIATTDPNCSANGTCPWGPGVDPNSVALFALYPHSNSFNSGDGYNTAAYSFSAPIPSVLETYIAKLDYNITSKNQLFVRGNLQNDLASSAPQFPGQPASSNNVDDTKGLAGGDTWALTNNLVNNARYAFIRQSFGNKGIGSGSFVNFRGFTPPVAETRSTVVNVPAQNFIDDLSWTHKSHTIQFGANWRLIHNNRTSDANSFSGATTNAFWLTGSKIANSGGAFDPAAFNLPSVDASFGTSYDFAISALAGLVDEETDTYNYHVSKDGKSGSIIAPGAAVGRQFKANEFEYYLQDAWRATPNLTFTFGLRHTILQTPYEINGQQVQPTLDLHNWFTTRGQQAALGNSVQPDIGFAPSGQARGMKAYYPTNWKDIAPRFSVAYSPHADDGFLHRLFGSAGKSSLRAGAGIYYDHFGQGIVNSFDKFGSFSLTSSLQNPANVLTPDTTARFTGLHKLPGLNGAGLGNITYPVQPSNDPLTTGFAITYGLDDHIKTPYSEVFDLSFQREMKGGFTLEADYIGRFGRHLLQEIDLAQPLNLVDKKSGMDYYTAATQLSKDVDQGLTDVPAIAYFEDLFPDAAGLDSYGDGKAGNSATQNIYNDDWVYSRGNETGALYNLDVFCYPGCGGKTQRYWPGQYSSLYAWGSVGSSSYNAAQITLRHPSSHGLQLDLSYTFSKAQDMGSDTELNSTFGGNNYGFLLDAWNPGKNYSISDYNTTNLFSGDWVYRLPFGRGQHFGSGSNRLVDTVIGGWQWSGLARMSSGLPFTLYDGNGWATNWEYESAMVQTGKIDMHKHRDSLGRVQAFAKPSKLLSNLRLPYPGEAGQRNKFIGDGFFGVDTGFAKAWHLYESNVLQFGAEIYNVTNSARFDPHSIDGGSTDGSVLGTYSGLLTSNRRMQFSLRYNF